MKKAKLAFFFMSGSLVFLLFMVVWGCQPSAKVTEITFGLGPGDLPSTQPLIDQFNKENEGEIKVTVKESNRLSNEFYKELQADFLSKEVNLDVISGDVVWTATFASKGWVEDISSDFYQEYAPSSFVKAAMNSAIYDFKVWGVPWYTDVGIIFYRKDLLEKSGFKEPPVTWDELKDISKKVMKDAKVKYGYAFQGADYEGGVTNACEFIWNAGGDIVIGNLAVSSEFDQSYYNPNVIIVDSEESAAGFKIANDLIVEGIAPLEAIEYREQESLNAFLNEEAVFLRSWPANYSAFLEKDAKVKANQIGVCKIPVAVAGASSFSCLGGWNLMINSQTTARKKKAAWQFIKFLTQMEQQRFRAQLAGMLPTLKSLYEDIDLLEEVPVIKLAKEVIPNSRERPISPFYMAFSPKISSTFNKVLKGEVLPELAVSYLQIELENIGVPQMSSN